MSQSSLLKSTLQPLRDHPDELIDIILRQAGVIDELRQEIQQLKEQIKDLNDRNDRLGAKVEQLQSAVARQAAPFRIDEKHRVIERKRPGRAQGHRGTCRATPDHVDQEIFVPLVECPHCRGEVGPRRSVVQYIEELPVVRPHVTKLVTEEAASAQCKQSGRSSPPLQGSLR